MTQAWLALVLTTLAIGCGSSSDVADPAPTLEPGPGAYAADFRDSGAFFTRMSEPRKGLASSPHGIVQIFYSNNLLPATGRTELEAPEGTVAIKPQDQNGDGKIDTIQVMIKKAKGYDDFSHDWLFERYFGDGRLDVSAGPSLNFCGKCHNGFGETSELAGTSLAN